MEITVNRAGNVGLVQASVLKGIDRNVSCFDNDGVLEKGAVSIELIFRSDQPDCFLLDERYCQYQIKFLGFCNHIEIKVGENEILN
jgi:hypothetical protein